MLNAAALARVRDKLEVDGGGVCAADFSIESRGPEEDESPGPMKAEAMAAAIIAKANSEEVLALTLTYRHNTEYVFKATFLQSSVGSYTVNAQLSPGEFLPSETWTGDGLAEIYNVIGVWARRVADEVKAGPAFRELQRQEEEIQRLFERVEDLELDGAFDRGEVESMSARLDAFEQALAQQASESEEMAAKLKSARKDIRDLKAQLAPDADKRTWWRKFAVRMARWITSPEGQKLLEAGSTIVKQLGSGDGPPPAT